MISALVRSHSPNGICFLAVYIAGIHEPDEWSVGKTISCADQPITLAQRLKNAQQFKKNFNFQMPMLVDSLNNGFHHTYGLWPFCFFVIYEGVLVLKVEPDKETLTYVMNEIGNWITSFCRSNEPTV